MNDEKRRESVITEVATMRDDHDDDDVWGSDNEGEPGRRSELDHEWQARQSQFHTLGYRDGVDAGKHSSVQQGFNLGYGEATAPGFNWGVARGLTSAFAALPASVKESLVVDSAARARLEGLNSSIRSFSSTDALLSFHRDLHKTSDSEAVPGLAAQAEGFPDKLGLGLGFGGSMAGIRRLPESHGVGVWKSENNSSSGISSSVAGKSELEDMEKKVRSEFEVASVKMSDVLEGA